jgi:ATP phosphoribosyltransferase
MGNVLKFALPAGSLQEQTFSLFEKAGWKFRLSSRSYYPSVDDPEIEAVLVRPQEMPRYIARGAFDAGICGKDWVLENGVDLVEAAELRYNKATGRPARWVLAVKEESAIKTAKDLQGKRIATEMVNFVKKWLAERGVKAEIEFSWGATEMKVPDLVDAIVDITETGSSLKANKLKIIETLVESYPVLVAGRGAWADPWKKKKISAMALMLQGALAARDKVGLKMNIPKARLDEICRKLPALRNPTVSPLSDTAWVAAEVIIDEAAVRELVPVLEEMGAEGIIEYPLNKVIP